MLMINNIKNYLYDRKYFINLYDDYIHIFNYLKLLDFNPDSISLEMPAFVIKVSGDDMFITKMTDNELLIKGCIYNVELKYE